MLRENLGGALIAVVPLGVRTLVTRGARYNPLGHHARTVWPNDNSLIVAGLANLPETIGHVAIRQPLDYSPSPPATTNV